MLETVRFHTLLVTANPEIETMQERWMNKGHHDVIMECAEFALERLHAPVNREVKEPPRARPMIEPQNLILEQRPHLSPLSALSHQAEMWSPSLSCGLETPPPSKLSHPHTPLSQNQVSIYFILIFVE
jgi:hypothetical protein